MPRVSNETWGSPIGLKEQHVELREALEVCENYLNC